jgi:hypothetical protein
MVFLPLKYLNIAYVIKILLILSMLSNYYTETAKTVRFHFE